MVGPKDCKNDQILKPSGYPMFDSCATFSPGGSWSAIT